MRTIAMVAMLLMAGAVQAADEPMACEMAVETAAQQVETNDTVVYSVEVYRDNTLVFGQDVTAVVGETAEFVIAPEGDMGVGMVGYVWPTRLAEGLDTRLVVDADWVDGEAENALQVARIEDHINTQTLDQAALRGLVTDVGAYQVFVVQKTP